MEVVHEEAAAAVVAEVLATDFDRGCMNSAVGHTADCHPLVLEEDHVQGDECALGVEVLASEEVLSLEEHLAWVVAW